MRKATPPSRRANRPDHRGARRRPVSALLPAFVAEGFLRDDFAVKRQAIDGDKWMRSGLKPVVGQTIKVQLTFRSSMPTALSPSERSTWCLMGGDVLEVVGESTVITTARPTTDNAPAVLDRDWLLVLAFDDAKEFPWTVVAMLDEDAAPLARGPRERRYARS